MNLAIDRGPGMFLSDPIAWAMLGLLPENKVTPMRELPKDIDADVVIEIGKLLDDSPLFVPVRVHELAIRVRQRVKTGLPDLSIEELIVEMAAVRQLAMAFDLPGSENVVRIPLRRPRR